MQDAVETAGTCTGKYGVGPGKRKYLALEQRDEALRVRAAIKDALDPDHILNPGKVLPD